jgi:hypothetical protein
MIINMVTFAGRRVHYIDKTLEYLHKSDGRDIPLNLILGSYDTSHVEKFRGVANLVLWDGVAEGESIAGNLRHSCTLNAIRALNYGDDDQCLCCEDDIGFQPDWYHQLKLTIEQIREKEYILSLGQQCDQSADQRYATHTKDHLTGAQGIFYPGKRFRNAVGQFVQQNMRRGTNDNLIGEFGKKYAKLYNTSPTLIWHLGQVSSFHTKSRPSAASPQQG